MSEKERIIRYMIDIRLVNPFRTRDERERGSESLQLSTVKRLEKPQARKFTLEQIYGCQKKVGGKL